jgi:hypothetical protein
MSTAAAAVSYAVFALGSKEQGTTGLLILLASRLLAGVCGANITVAQAYIADISPPEQRSKRMGLIGMAFGLGFVFRSGARGREHQVIRSVRPRLGGSGLVRSEFLPDAGDSRRKLEARRNAGAARPHFAQWAHTFSQPKLALLIAIFFLATFCFTCFETTLGLLISENFKLDKEQLHDATISGYLFAYCGIVGAFVQGGAIGKLVKKFGEPKLIALSLVIFGMSLAPLPFIKGGTALSWSVLLRPEGHPGSPCCCSWACFRSVSSLTRPPVFGIDFDFDSRARTGSDAGCRAKRRKFGPDYWAHRCGRILSVATLDAVYGVRRDFDRDGHVRVDGALPRHDGCARGRRQQFIQLERRLKHAFRFFARDNRAQDEEDPMAQCGSQLASPATWKSNTHGERARNSPMMRSLNKCVLMVRTRSTPHS